MDNNSRFDSKADGLPYALEFDEKYSKMTDEEKLKAREIVEFFDRIIPDDKQ